MTGPKKVFESNQVVVFDQFLDDDDFETLHDHMMESDYKHINMGETLRRAWKMRDGHPMRGNKILFKYAKEAEAPDESWVYPSNSIMDKFVDQLFELTEKYPDFVGLGGKDWEYFSANPWIYQQNTGLSLHTDGSSIYSGAYTYFATKKWDIHWGGLLMVMDEATDLALHRLNEREGADKLWRNNFDFEKQNKAMFESGFAQCVFPKANRIVLINSTVNHMVSHINQYAGENVRMSVAGFFHKYKKK